MTCRFLGVSCRLKRHGRIAKTALIDRHSGREGKVLVINGRSEPAYEIAAGQVERWRIVNACSARYEVVR